MTSNQVQGIGSRSIDDVIDATRRLYATADKKRLAWDLWFHTCHHVGALALALRTSASRDDQVQELADTTLWLFTVLSRASEPLIKQEESEPDLQSIVRILGSGSDQLWLRYPGQCPVCLDSKGNKPSTTTVNACRCELPNLGQLPPKQLRSLVPRLRKLGAARATQRPLSLDAWQELLTQIYMTHLNSVSHLELASIVSEQTGFVSDSMLRLYSYTFDKAPPTGEEVKWRATWFGLELARLTGLILLAASKIGESLASAVGRRYSLNTEADLTCWACKQSSCACRLCIAPHDVSVRELLGRMAS